MTIDEVRKQIEQGKSLLLAGDEKLLNQLPQGKWIGGTIPYFVAQNGGETCRDRVFTNILPESCQDSVIKFYDVDSIPNVAVDAPANGITIIIIPANSDIHLSYAKDAPLYRDMYRKPIIGWISGTHLDDEHVFPKVYSGTNSEWSGDKAIVMHITLPDHLIAEVGTVDPFSPGHGDVITFPKTGFKVSNCRINGEDWNFADYLRQNKISTVLPLVANFCGTQVNVSFRDVDTDRKDVTFYAPVFEHVEYRVAKPIDDYVEAFQSALPELKTEVIFSCFCVLNFLYSQLEGKKVARFKGPATFGEIAFQLLNQTAVYLRVHEKREYLSTI